ncbi:MAG: archaeal heat shock protein Hsp20 [Candidatus Hadarchaeales archaeon]
MDFWEDWFERRPFRRLFREIDRAFEEMFKEMSSGLPKELFRERRMPDGSTVKTFGPVVYGYSMTIGPDGVPRVRTFGNVKPGMPVPKPMEYREPLVEVITGKDVIRVVAELPGVEKKDIDLRVKEDRVTISVDTPERRYYKEVELPAPVDPKSADAFFQSGVLDVTLRRKEERPGDRIEVK